MTYWFINPKVLFEKKKFKSFFPRSFMTNLEKVNSIARFSLYYFILNVFIFKNYKWLSLSITLLIFSFIFAKIKNKEGFDNSIFSNCKNPTVNNPYMNKLPYDKSKRNACDSTNELVRNKMLDNFDPEKYNPYSNIWKKSISDRQFYTLPSTGIINNQTKFAKWLYGNDTTCKIDGSNCLKNKNKYHQSRYI
jgi:hypothetical protein